PRREVRSEHGVGKLPDLGRVLGLAEDDGEVRARGAVILRPQRVIRPGESAPSAVDRRARKRARRGDGGREPDARSRRGERTQHRVAARHFFLHGSYPKRIGRRETEGGRSVRLAAAAAFPYLVFAVLAAVSWNRWIEPYVDTGRELVVPWRVAHGER